MRTNKPQCSTWTWCLFILMFAFSAIVYGETTENVQYTCKQPIQEQLECDYHLNNSLNVTGIVVSSEGNELPATQSKFYPQANDNTAILLIVDTYLASSVEALQQKVQHLKSLLSLMKAHHQIGLATFSGYPHIDLALGSTTEDALEASQSLIKEESQQPRKTDLNESIDKLASFSAKRRVVFFFTEGLAKPELYYNEALVKKIKRYGIIFNIVGYSSGTRDNPGLTELSKLSKLSGGTYITTSYENDLPHQTFSDLIENLDKGNRIAIDLTPIMTGNPQATKPVNITLLTNGEKITWTTEANFSQELPQQESPIFPAATDPASTPINQFELPPTPPSYTLRSWLWYAIPIISMALISLAYFFYQRFQPNDEEVLTVANEVCAFLIPGNDEAKRFVILHSPWRIGRGPDNDLTLTDNSVSRNHAEIIRNRDGTFGLRDLESLNGVYLNNKKVPSAILTEGDEIDIGDVRFTFTLNDVKHGDGQKTAIFKGQKLLTGKTKLTRKEPETYDIAL